jgi:hypothetical protein
MRREPTEEEIAARAHQLYEQRGRVDGHAMEDWLAAESEIEGMAMSPVSREARGTDDVVDKPATRKSSSVKRIRQ